MGPREWNILVVDDEPDVLSVTKLALRSVEVNGLPLNVIAATSKAEAIDILSQDPSWMSSIAVAFIDVVMETDTAGLELCDYIRNELQNSTTQIYVRTGQPGVAPERAVIDRYDISGYFTKAEATEDKLYSLVKSGIRQFSSIRNMAGAFNMLEGVIAAAESRQAMRQVFGEMLGGFLMESDRNDATYFAVGDDPFLGPFGWDISEALAVKSQLENHQAVPLRGDGDHYFYEDGNLLIKIMENEAHPESIAMIRTAEKQLGHQAVMAIHTFMRNIATMWPRAN
ncbi:MAG: response regulator [Anaerolineae bacterium]|nr:response regulator [Anaerolineae bacterium]